MTIARQLRHRLAFESRSDVDDGAGNPQSGPWTERFSVRAAMQAKFGGEAVTAARLSGQQLWIVTVRQSRQTSLITTDWRARDTRTGEILAVKSPPVDPDDGCQWFEILCQTGVAA